MVLIETLVMFTNKEEDEPDRIFVDAEDEYESLWTRFINHASPPLDNLKPMSVPESYDGNPRFWKGATYKLVPITETEIMRGFMLGGFFISYLY